MDYNFLMFTIGFSCFLGLLVYAEVVYKKRKQKKRNEIAVKRMSTFIEQAKNEKRIKEALAKKESMIDYYLKFRLEYDPDTHTYVKVERVTSDQTDVYKAE
tara:strand:- start:47 stop:349 length:303 start_codon:yes stop_codon:yes gene_type:complete